MDCAGVPNGSSVFNDCGICGDGTCIDEDNDGTCDCIDDCVGSFDECGICNGTGQVQCSNDGNCGCANEGHYCTADGCCGGPNGYNSLGCDGICRTDGTEFTEDACGYCGDGYTIDIGGPCSSDCIDVCGQCGGDCEWVVTERAMSMSNEKHRFENKKFTGGVTGTNTGVQPQSGEMILLEDNVWRSVELGEIEGGGSRDNYASCQEQELTIGGFCGGNDPWGQNLMCHAWTVPVRRVWPSVGTCPTVTTYGCMYSYHCQYPGDCPSEWEVSQSCINPQADFYSNMCFGHWDCPDDQMCFYKICGMGCCGPAFPRPDDILRRTGGNVLPKQLGQGGNLGNDGCPSGYSLGVDGSCNMG
jgi:hypothetical protein